MADTAEQENKLIKCVRELLNPKDPQAEECESCACTVKEFFEAIGKTVDKKGSPVTIKVRIPAYQRPYAWDVREVNQLIQDLETKASTESPYHLGTIILHYDKEGEKTFNVVDGQQRLRTFEMLLGKNVQGGESSKFYVPLEEVGEDKETREAKEEEKKKEKRRRVIPNDVEKLCNEKSDDFKARLECGTIICLIVQNIDEAFQLFETQNGRGKPLSVENLLKAYHYHEMTHGDFSQRPTKERLYELERQWETEVVGKLDNEETGARCSVSVLTKHLWHIRHWARGEEKEKKWPARPEDRANFLEEYKGLTLSPRKIPLQNLWAISQEARGQFSHSLLLRGYLAQRFPEMEGESLDPFVTICQPIINGETFFEYARTFARMEHLLFDVNAPGIPELEQFRKVYKKLCCDSHRNEVTNVENKKSYTGDYRSKTVYETFILLTMDRFGLEGVLRLHLALWILAYYDRLKTTRLYYKAAGDKYGRKVCALLSTQASLECVVFKVNEWVEEAKSIKVKDDRLKDWKSQWDKLVNPPQGDQQ